MTSNAYGLLQSRRSLDTLPIYNTAAVEVRLPCGALHISEAIIVVRGVADLHP